MNQPGLNKSENLRNPFFCLGLALYVLLSGCSKEKVTAASDTAPAAAVEPVADRSIVSVANAERFAVAPALARSESDQILATGTVAADVSRSYTVNSLSSGRVVEVKARLGDDVQKGQLLLTMTSPDMSQAFADFQKSQAADALAKSQLDRARVLLAHGAAPQKDVDVAEDTYNRAIIDTKAAEDRIRLLGGDPARPSSLIEIHAPVSGTIVEQNVTSAAGVKSLDNSPNLFTIADLSNVWILCDVYENDLAHIHVGDRAEIELNAYPGRQLNGRVTNISKLLDPNTRTAKVRIELTNPDGVCGRTCLPTSISSPKAPLPAPWCQLAPSCAFRIAIGCSLNWTDQLPQNRGGSRSGQRRQDATDSERPARRASGWCATR